MGGICSAAVLRKPEEVVILSEDAPNNAHPSRRICSFSQQLRADNCYRAAATLISLHGCSVPFKDRITGVCRATRMFSICAGSSKRNARALRSEEHTSELQSQSNLVCRL